MIILELRDFEFRQILFALFFAASLKVRRHLSQESRSLLILGNRRLEEIDDQEARQREVGHCPFGIRHIDLRTYALVR